MTKAATLAAVGSVLTPDSSGNVSISGKKYQVSGVATNALAWVNFNSSSGSSCVVNASYNVSSVTYNGTGDYTVVFTNAMTDANYALVGYGQRTDAATPPVLFSGSTAGSTYLTTSVRVRASYPWTNATYVDCLKACIVIFGN